MERLLNVRCHIDMAAPAGNIEHKEKKNYDTSAIGDMAMEPLLLNLFFWTTEYRQMKNLDQSCM